MSKRLSFDQLVNRYLDNELTPEEFDVFCQQIAGDTELRKRFLALSAMDFAIGQAADHRDRQNTIEAALAQVDQEPEQDVIFELYRSVQAKSDQDHADRPLRMRDVLSLSGYVARKALRDTRVVSGLVAALLLIGVFTFFQISGLGGKPSATDRSADDSLASEDSAEPANLVTVATLTAERDAAWERRPGVDLYAGQRLMLTHGFAEIRTVAGAIAVVQAPATIELLDHQNAIKLHSGKLVGTCETESSKGFLVYTPQLEITDLGTEFGVDVQQDGQTEVHVFEGEVEASATNAATQAKPTRLTAGDSVRASANSREIGRIELNTDDFAKATLTATARHRLRSKGRPGRSKLAHCLSRWAGAQDTPGTARH